LRSLGTPPFGRLRPRREGSGAAASTGIVVRVAALLCCAAIVGAVWSVSASASIGHPYLSSFGAFSSVQGVATDAAGDVYVYDSGAGTIFKFDASGNPVNFASTSTNEITGLPSAGPAEGEIAVDDSSGPAKGNIYVAHASSSGVPMYNAAGESLGELGEAPGQPWGEACGVAVDPSGNVFIGLYPSAVNEYKPTSGTVTNVDYSSSIEGLNSPCNIAVDQAGNVFADTWPEGPVSRFEASQFGASAATGSLVDAAGSTLTVDPATQEIYVDERSQIEQFGPHGEPFEGPVGKFAQSGEGTISNSFGIAVGPVNHDIYVSDGKGKLSVFGAAVTVPTVSTGAASELSPTGATLGGSVNPEGIPVSKCLFEYGADASYGHSAPCESSPGSGTAPVTVTAKITALQPDTTYHYRLSASNENGASEGSDESFVTAGPGLHGTSTVDASDDAVTFRASIDPNGAPTSAYFQYGTSTAYGTNAPAAPGIPLGSSEGDVELAQHAQGLAPGTLYHYRVVAINDGKEFPGPDQTFTTQGVGGELTLLDGRQWEMVSPPVKHGAGIIPDSGGGGVVQASPSGDALVYLAQSPIEAEAEGNAAPENSQILARRTADGTWSNRTMTTRNEEAHRWPVGHGTEYKMFTADLSSAILEPYGNTPLAPDATDERSPYLRDEAACAAGSSSCFTPFLTRENTLASAKWDLEPESLLLSETFLDATPDLKHAIFSSKEVKLIEGAGESGLYEWSAGKLQFVSINEAGEAVNGELGSERGHDKRNVISSDGSRVFWCETQCTDNSAGGGPLFMRDTDTEETIRIDPTGDHYRDFQGATEDGSRVFFTTEFTGESQPRLSECTIVETAGKFGCETLAIAPELQGAVLGINGDGSLVYFVSKAALVGTAQAGANNLYVSRLQGGKWEARLIATLGPEDEHDWGTANRSLIEMTARVSPDGRYLTFMSNRSLTGYDNHDALSGEPDQEVFLYDGQTGKLNCPSCNRSGVRPHGLDFESFTLINQGLGNRWVAADIPVWSSLDIEDTLRQPRYLSNEGRLFFNSTDALVPQDSNGVADVYEYEPEGLGSCAQADGCVNLISSGASGQESAFVEASESGGDVFFVSTARLSTQDVDTDYDVYDAHICTSTVPCLQTSVSPPPCASGEACKAAPTPQPAIFGAPASATFTGAGNPAPPAAKPSSKAKRLTRAQQLAKALKSCRKDKSKAKRSSCEKQARKKYGTKAKAKAKSHKANSGKSKAHKGGN
jgi:hypothetical protein